MSVINRNSGSAVYDTFAIALTKNMRVGQVCIVKGHITANDGLGAQYGVEANGSGGIEMNNGNELVILDGETLKPASVANISGLVGTVDGQQISVGEYNAGSNVGNFSATYRTDLARTAHDGVRYHSPARSLASEGLATYLTEVTDTDLGLWENKEVLTLEMAGGYVGLANNSPSWQALLNTNPASIDFDNPGTYAFLASSIHSQSVKITSAPGVIIDCTDPSYTGSYWTQFEGSIEQIENLSVSPTIGETQVTFASAPSLSTGDVFIIWNPTDFSWSGFRSNYYAGEYCEVEEISSNDAILKNNLYDSYVFGDVNIYKLNSITVDIEGLKIIGSTSANLINLVHNRGSSINCEIEHVNNSCLSISRCYDVTASGLTINNEGDGGDDYGVSIGNSQNIKISQSTIYSRRHSVTTGGGSNDGAVPCRNIVISGSTLKNSTQTSVHNADFHGNTEDSQYIDCKIYGGVTWQGKNNGYVNCRIHPTSLGVVVTSAEILGGDFYLRGCDIYTTANPQTSSKGVIDIGGSTSVVTADTVFDCNFEVSGGFWNGNSLGSNTFLIYFRNRGTTQKVNIKFCDVDLNVNDFSAVIRTDVVSGTAASDYMIADNITTGLTAKNLFSHSGNFYRDFPHRTPTLTGIEELTTDTGETTTVGTSVNFKWVYPRTPHVSMARANAGSIGGSYGIVSANTADTNNIIPAIRNEAGANWGAAVAVDVCWSVSIREV